MQTRKIAFVDYENFPRFFYHLAIEEYDRVYVLIGSQQHHFNIEMVQKLQPLGKRLEYIHVRGTSRNNLDFHLAALFGECHGRVRSDVEFVIFSNDTDFDFLLAHYSIDKGRPCSRTSGAEPRKLLEVALAVENPDYQQDLNTILSRLKRIAVNNRPKRVSGLINQIENSLRHQPQNGNGHAKEAVLSPEGEIIEQPEPSFPTEAYLNTLIQNGLVQVDGQKVTYLF
jgi:hypothetical protein